MRTARAAQGLISRALFLPRGIPSSFAGASTAALAAERRNRWWFPPNAAAVKSVPIGIAGAVSFSLTLTTVAEAKERPPTNLLPKEVVLYQYQACPFCNKVRAFLDYHDIPYKVVEVNPLSKKEIKWSDYKKVPILVVDGEQLVDSSGSGPWIEILGSVEDHNPSYFTFAEIINKLNHRINPDDAATNEEEAEWRRWVDDHLVHLLSPNIYRTTAEALESFDYFSKIGNFSLTEKFAVKYMGAAAMYMVAKKLKKKYNITDERAALYDAANTWTEVLNGRDFLGGSKPNLADLAVFGVLRPIRNLQAGRDLVENTKIGEWYDRMDSAVGDPSRINA